MRVGNKQVVDEVFVFDLGRRAATTTTFLRLVDVDRLSLGIATVGQRDHDLLARNQIAQR